MAFVRLDKNLPQDPTYPADLTELGYTLNDKGQFVRIGTDQDFFTFYHTDNERANEVRKEAMHQAVRQTIDAEIFKLGVQQLHCREDTFHQGKPCQEATIPILATRLEKLKAKKNVIIIVGERSQDLGIWSYRLTMNEGGMDAGTAVGLLKKLQQWETQKAVHDSRAASNNFDEALKKLKLGAKDEYVNDENTPGIIILNCGQLLWSNEQKKAMNISTWLARPKKNAIDEQMRIDSYWNRVKGHEDEKAHVESVFNHVIPQVTNDEARFYLVGISDGAEALLEYMGTHYYGHKKPALKGHIEAFALTQPSHNVDALKCLSLETELNRRGKSWVLDGNPKGTLLATPELGFMNKKMPEDLEPKKPLIITRRRHGSRSSTSSPINVPGTSGRSDKEDAIAEDIQTYVRPRFLSDASSYTMPSTSPIPESLPHQAQMSGVDIRPRTTSASSARPRLSSMSSTRPRHSSISSTRPRLSSISSAAVPPALDASVTSLTTDSSADATPVATPTSPVASPTSPVGDSYTNPKMLSSWDDLNEEEEEDSYRTVVSCPTFSAGVDLVESIFPAVMDDVLDHFQRIAANADELTKRTKLMALEGEESEDELRLDGV